MSSRAHILIRLRGSLAYTRAAAALEYSIPAGHRLAQYGLHCLIIIRVGFSPRRPFVGARRSLGRNRAVKGLLQSGKRVRRGEISRVFDLGTVTSSPHACQMV